MNKQRLFIFIGLAIILASALSLLILRLFLSTNEDVWLCVGGQWVKHGNPSSAMPQTSCSGEKNFNNDSSWKIYQSKTYDFEISYPGYWNVETYGPYQSSSLKVAEVLLAQKTSDYENDPNRQIYWVIDVWKPSVVASQIAKDSGFLNYDVKQLNLVGQAIQMASSSLPSAINNNIDNFRLFLAQNSKYVYSLKSQTCSSPESVDCIGVLSSFKLLAK